jgi:Zn-finger nucleic acid-binding protein
MKCPACRDTLLTTQPLEVEGGLSAKVCSSCDGKWIDGTQYMKWLDAQGHKPPERPSGIQTTITVARDSGPAKLCPTCGRFLTRSKVGHGIDFHLDRCPACGGIWFDSGEWEILKAHNLHDDVHFVFSTAWQAEIARADRAKRHEQLLEQKLGANDLKEIKRIKIWLDTHAERAELYAYLIDHLAPSPRSGRSN